MKEVRINTMEIQKILRDDYEQSCTNKLET